MPSPRSSFTRFVLTVLVGVPVAVVLIWPQAVGASRLPVIAHLVAFRVPIALSLGAVALVLGTVAMRRRAWGVMAGAALVVGASALAHGGIVMARGAVQSLPPGDLTVMVWNTQGGATSAADVARVVLEVKADMVSLPETDSVAVGQIADLLAAEGYGMQADTTYGPMGASRIPTSVLIANHLGSYVRDESAGSTPGLPSGVWRPASGDGPIVVAAHPLPPLPGMMGEWEEGLRWVADQCSGPHVIVAGDLNATVDHLWGLGEQGALVGRCDDAAIQAGGGGVGTWPAHLPAWLAAPIDHVLVGSDWVARGVTVLPSSPGGSDHRAVVAVLATTASTR